MKRMKKIALLAAGAMLLAAQSQASGLVKANCAGCHKSDGRTIWGTIVPGSQTGSSLAVSTGSKVWKVVYDDNSELDNFLSARDLRDDKAVAVEFSRRGPGRVYAEEISYKPGYHFHTLDNIVTMAEVSKVLEKSPEEGHYMIVDARGIDNFIEGHLPNAVNIPYYRLLEFKDRLPKDKTTRVIAYCRGFT